MDTKQRQFVLAFLVVALLAAGAWTVDVRVGEDVTLECRFNPTLMDKRHTFYWIRANIKEKDNVAIGESPLEKNYRISFKPAEGQYDLLVSGATYDRDNGRFECRLKEQGTGIELHSQSVDLVVLVPPSSPQINPVSPVAVEGQPTELVCSSAGGSPDPVLRWYRKGEANPLEGAIMKAGGSKSVATQSTLIVRPQKEDDGAEYRCVAWNRAMDTNDKKEANIVLAVNYAPRVRVSPSPLNVERGGSVQIQCQVDAKPAVYSVRWTRSGRFIATSFNHTLRSVSLEDDGLYVCSADNGLGQVGEAELQLDVLHPPVVTIAESRKEVDIGSSVSIPCNVSAKPAPTSIEWLKEGDAQFRSNGPVLRLNRVAAADNGRYLCRATNMIGSAERSGNATFQLLVKHEPGSARISPEEPIAVDEASITLTCAADPPGWPLPQYRWWKAGAETTILASTSELTIHVARQNSEGTYYCQPSNDLGTGGSSYVNLRVFQPPRFIGQLPPVLQKKAQDADFNMTCSAQGKPKPSITWLKDGVEILPGSSSGAYDLAMDESEGRNAIFTVRSTLRFHGSERPALSQLTADDRGVYTCAFENQIRRIESTLTLKIEHAPILLDHRPKVASNVGSSSVQLLCQVQAYPRPNFEWSLRDVPIIGGNGGGAGDNKYDMNVTSITNAANGNDIYQGVLRINDVKESDYGDYTCKMWNAEGENAAAVRLQATSAPEKPTNLRVVQSGYDALTLEWDEGFNGGFDNTIYTVLYRSASSSGQAGSEASASQQQQLLQEDDCQYANPCVIRGLEQLQSYTFQVRAENTKGKSPLGNALTASTVVDLSRIPEPKQVTFEPKTKTISFNVDSQLPLMAMVESRVEGNWELSQKISVRSPVSREVLDLVKDDVDDIRLKLCLEMNTTLCSEPVVAVTGDLIQEPTKALTELPAKYMVAIIVACVVGSLVFVLFAIFYCYRRRRAQKLKKLLEMEKAHSARPTITQQQQQQQQQQPPPPYYAGLENKGRDQSLMNTSHGSMLDDAASKNALYATQNGYGYAVASAQNNGNGGHANGGGGGGGDWVNMAYTEHSYSNSNNGGSVNSQDSLWQLKLASQNGGGVNGGGADHQLGNVPDSRSYHYDPMTHGGYGGFEDYSHYPPSNGDDYLQRNNYGVVAGGDPYAAVHKNGKRMEHLESTYHNVSGLPDPYMEAEPEEMKQHQQQQQQQQQQQMAPPQQHHLSFDESLESGYSTPNSRNRRVIREIIV